MEKLLQFITDIEKLNLPCRYTISLQNDTVWAAAKVDAPAGERVIDFSRPIPATLSDILATLQQFMPSATVCQINDNILIDNLK